MSNSNPANLLPPPPQVVVGGPTPMEQSAMSNNQFKSLLKIIGGKKRKGRSRSRKNRRTRTRNRSLRRKSRRRIRRRTSRHRGGNTLQISTPPVSYNETAYPSVTDISRQLAETTAQSNANSKLDAVGVVGK